MAQFWLNKGEYCGPNEETGVRKDRYRNEKRRGREREIPELLTTKASPL